MEQMEKEATKEKAAQISALESEDTIEAQYRAVEIATSIDDEKLSERMTKATASRLIGLLEAEGSEQSLKEIEQLKAEYFS